MKQNILPSRLIQSEIKYLKQTRISNVKQNCFMSSVAMKEVMKLIEISLKHLVFASNVDKIKHIISSLLS